MSHDDPMDALFDALMDDVPQGVDAQREDAAVDGILARLGVEPQAVVPRVIVASEPARSFRRPVVFGALAAALLLGVFLGRNLGPIEDGPVATIASPRTSPEVVLSAPPPPPSSVTEAEVAAPPVLPASRPPTAPVVPERGSEPEAAPPQEATASSAGSRKASLQSMRTVYESPRPGLKTEPGTRLYVSGRLGELERGALTFVRRDGLTPPVDRVRFPALGVSALPVGTVFLAAAVENLALVGVTEGEVHLVTDDGARLGSVRAGEAVAVGPGEDGPRMVSTQGIAASDLAVFFPDASADERAIHRALAAQRLRSLSPDLVQDLRGLEKPLE